MKQIIINEIKRVVSLLGRQDITRDEFLKLVDPPLSITRNDIEKYFGKWSNAFSEAGFIPVKWDKISDDELFEEYSRVKKLLGHIPLGEIGLKEINDNSKYSGSTYKKRFKSLKQAAIAFTQWERKKGLNNSSVNIDTINEEIQKEEVKLIDRSKNKSKNDFVTRNFIGKAAEHLITSELIFRGYNAQILPVDEGIDIVAIKDKKPFFIQVKHSSYERPDKSGLVKITLSSFLNHQEANVYYFFVLGRKEPSRRDFLIMPYHKMNEFLGRNIITHNDNAGSIGFYVLHKVLDDAYINRISNESDVSFYLNNWNQLR